MTRRVVRAGDPRGNVARNCFPLWSIERQVEETGKLWLPGVKTVVYTVAGSRYRDDPHVFRRARCQEFLERAGFTDWRFFYGTRCEPYWRGIAQDHAELLSEHDPPLLILEDDVEVRDWHANLNLPGNCHVAQLGGGRGGDRRGIIAAREAGLRPIECYRYAYLPIDAEWMRVFGMWFSHAILWLDRATMLSAADLLRRRREMVDGVYATEQWRWNWYCRRVPMVWQNDGHHYRDTFEYQPRAIRGE